MFAVIVFLPFNMASTSTSTEVLKSVVTVQSYHVVLQLKTNELARFDYCD
jgi:hypothetical protein